MQIWIDETRIDEFLVRERFAGVAALTTSVLKTHPEMMSDDQQHLKLQRAVAEAHLHRTAQALDDLQQARANGATEGDYDQALELLQVAEIELWTGTAQQAQRDATKAEHYFSSNAQFDSDLRASLLVASASKALKDTTTYNQYSSKAVDILASLEHTWEPQVVQSYLSRSDLRTLMRLLPRNGTTNISGR